MGFKWTGDDAEKQARLIWAGVITFVIAWWVLGFGL